MVILYKDPSGETIELMIFSTSAQEHAEAERIGSEMETLQKQIKELESHLEQSTLVNTFNTIYGEDDYELLLYTFFRTAIDVNM